METNNWYIRGKKGCTEQIRKEFIKRGADDLSLDNELFDEKEFIYYLVCGLVRIVEDGSILGKRIIEQWNEVTVPEPKTKPMFKPFDKVLVCDGEGEGRNSFWLATEFSRYKGNDNEYSYTVISNYAYRYCIPYEGNEHLNGVHFKPEHIEGYEWGG